MANLGFFIFLFSMIFSSKGVSSPHLYTKKRFCRNLLKTIVTCHSIDDEYFESVAKKNNIEDIDRCRKMLNVLKDSDALDRIRLEDPYIKIDLMNFKN